jgi:cytochrome c peroxidase
MYNAGMVTLKWEDFERDDPLFPEKSSHLRPLGLNRQDLADLEAFLHSLEEPPAAVGRPPLPALK